MPKKLRGGIFSAKNTHNSYLYNDYILCQCRLKGQY